jgi:hypothetical protein
MSYFYFISFTSQSFVLKHCERPMFVLNLSPYRIEITQRPVGIAGAEILSNISFKKRQRNSYDA